MKEVVQSLVDDGLVDTDKIGTSVYFWSFPSKATATRKRRLEEAEAATTKAEDRLDAAKKRAQEVAKGREDTKDRREGLASLIQLKARKEELEAEITKYQDCDPEVLDRLRGETKMAREGANRWTDNIYSLHSWIGKRGGIFLTSAITTKFGIFPLGQKFPSVSTADLNKQFGIPDDLDYFST